MPIQLPPMLGPEHYFEQFGGGVREGLSPNKGPIGGRGPKGHWGLPGALCISICSKALCYCHSCSGCATTHCTVTGIMFNSCQNVCDIAASHDAMHACNVRYSFNVHPAKEHTEGEEWNGDTA